MHRRFEIASPAEATDKLLSELEAQQGVILLSVRRGDSIKPPGDLVSLVALNTEADAVLEAITRQGRDHRRPSVVSAGVDSLLDEDSQDSINRDHDEAAWEETETALRRHSRLNLNFFLTTAAGGVLAACALISTSSVTQATALVAAAIVAPAFEPLARIGLSIITGHRRTLLLGTGSALAGYLTIIVAALLTLLVLRAGGHRFVSDLLRDRTFHEVQHPPVITLIISACGAIAGVIMVAAGRFTQLAGPLVALQLLPAAAAVGLALEVGEGGAAAHGLGRLAIDVGMVILAGVIVFAYKHVRVHMRRSVIH